MHSTLYYTPQFNNPQSEAASSFYTHAHRRGQRGQLWASLTGHPRGLLALGDIRTANSAEAQRDGDIRTVFIYQIRGSENRTTDFDRDFNPLQTHTEGRWLSIAQARQQGKVLPPVALIQVGDLYFVRDGHHRISVARALGQKTIEANVVVWQVTGPLPWETREQAVSLGIEGLIQQLRRECVRLQERVLLSFHTFMGAASAALKSPAVPRQGVDGL